ncbi:hypothetical protein HY496_00245 [Candidatus Woesearchaeota archaeon]|nr:hypothetical protein [Candidatus Woesearchaeota archaeon]
MTLDTQIKKLLIGAAIAGASAMGYVAGRIQGLSAETIITLYRGPRYYGEPSDWRWGGTKYILEIQKPEFLSTPDLFTGFINEQDVHSRETFIHTKRYLEGLLPETRELEEKEIEEIIHPPLGEEKY